MRSAKKSPEALQALRHTLVNRLTQEHPDVASAARWIREALGLNQTEFAALVGLSKPQIAKLERGEANPTLETLLAIGKPFGLRVGFYHPDVEQSVSPMLTQPDAAEERGATLMAPRAQVLHARTTQGSAKVGFPKLRFNKKST